MIIKPEFIIVHHIGGSDAKPLADTSSFSLEQLDKEHKKRFGIKSSLGYYVAYNYYILQDGTLIQTREDTERDMDALGYNFNSISVCLQGNFDCTMPTEKQKVVMSKLILQKSDQYNIKFGDIIFHRDIANKTCPGINFTKRMLLNSLIKQANIRQLLFIIIALLRKEIILE